MALKRYKPITNGRHNMITLDFTETTKTTPEESLSQPLPKEAGRNNQGELIARHHDGGRKCQHCVVDFKRDKDGTIAKVGSIQYGPNRSVNITLLVHADGERYYIIAPKGLQVGRTVESGAGTDIKVGNVLSLQNIPAGTVIHNIGSKPGRGGQIARSVGASSQVLGKEGKHVLIRLRSGKVRMILSTCRATIGRVGNLQHGFVNASKAGRSRWKGIRPTVRDSVMNLNGHPHGGGEDRVPIGRPSPMSPWSKSTLGKETCRGEESSDKLIVRGRKRKQ